MATNIWQNPAKSIPKSDPRIDRIDLTKSDLGARKSHIRGAHKKNDLGIRHVESK